MNAFRPLCLAFAVLLAGPGATAHERLTYAVTSQTTPPSGKTDIKPKSEEFPLTVILAHRYLVLEHHGKRTIFDFERRRVLELDLRKHTYEDFSLFTEIGFREIELQNRLVLAKALAAGGVKDIPMSPVLTEHLMSVMADDSQTLVERRAVDDSQAFSSEGHELATISNSGEPLPAEYRSEYWRFLRYYVGGHPKIWQALANRQDAAASLRMVLSNAGIETRVLQLKRVEAFDEAIGTTDGFSASTPAGEPYKTIAMIGPAPAESIDKHAPGRLAARDAALANGQVLEAVLAHFEWLFETGEESTWLATNRPLIEADGEVAQLFQALRPRNEKDATAAVETLATLQAKRPEQRYLLDVFAANTLSRLGKQDESVRRFLTVLRRNPLAVGPWIDLGGVYREGFNPRAAWACWDAARSLRPRHSFLKGPNEIEAKLVSDHPEFF